MRLRSGAVIIGLLLLATSCASDRAGGASTDTVVTSSVAAPTDGSAGAGERGAREDVPSALDDRENPAFPAPLVDPSEIRSGGPPPDGIPPIDDPQYTPATEIEFLGDTDPVVAIELNGDARAFPLEILTWHEIVNTEVGGQPVTISYCPLCNSAVAYDRRVGDRLLDFGTSGQLFNSSLVMYDRQTESLWTHFDGTAVIGVLTGTKLTTVPISIVGFGDWRTANPDGLVLNRDTGVDRDYGRNPYEGYDEPDDRPFLFDGEIPDDFSPKARVIGFEDGGDSVVVPRELVAAAGVFDVTVADAPVTIWWKAGALSALDAGEIAQSADIGAIATFSPMVDGDALTFSAVGANFVDDQTGSTWNILGQGMEGELTGSQLSAVPHHDTFWFAWIAFHPDARVTGA